MPFEPIILWVLVGYTPFGHQPIYHPMKWRDLEPMEAWKA